MSQTPELEFPDRARKMPRHFFDLDDSDLNDGASSFRDDEGTELADDQAARDEASMTMGELAKEYLPSSAPQRNITM